MNLRLLFLCTISFVVSILFTISVHAQIITTVAGGICMCTIGDGGPATAAGLHRPQGVAIDSTGNIYIVDGALCRVRIIRPSGIISTFAGIAGIPFYGGDGGPATAATIGAEYGVATDNFGNIYIGDDYNFRIRRVDAAGIITTFAGNGTSGYSGDGGPATAAEISGYNCSLATDAAGNVYFTDGTSRVRKINTAGIITTIAGTGVAGYSGDGGPATAAQFNIPVGIAADLSGNIYITDQSNYRVRKIDPSGIVSTFAGIGINGSAGDGGPATAASISRVCGVLADAAGDVYLGEGGVGGFGNRIRRISPGGIITTFAGDGTPSCGFGGDWGPATAAQLCSPHYIARYGNGNIYFTDRNNDRLRMISSHKPYFIRGQVQTDTICTGYRSVDSLLAVMDSNVAFTNIWRLVAAPKHGTAVVVDTNISPGGVMVPSGLSYTATTGYTGTDTFRVAVSDGIGYDTTTICLTIVDTPVVGKITGVDSVCPGLVVTLSSATGGRWSSSNTGIATVGSATGIVTGIATGTAVISYTVTNPGCSTSAVFTVKVRSAAACINWVGSLGSALSGLTLYPNPVGDVLYVDGLQNTATYRLLDVVGRVMLQGALGAGLNSINVSELASGVYVLEVSDAVTGERVTRRVVKR